MSDLHVSDLHVERGRRPIVNGVSLEVAQGSVVALLGPNGTGKSTMVLGLTGLLPIASGSIRLGDQELSGRKPDAIRGRGLAAVPEGHRVLTQLSVRDNILAAVRSARAADQQRALDSANELFPELEPLSSQLAGSLSGGQQQMLAFAQALASDPAVLVIDEMSLGLAPLIVTRLASVVTEMAARGIGVLLIEQYTAVALGLASHAYVMHRGRISYDGSASTLIEQPATLHAAYFGAQP